MLPAPPSATWWKDPAAFTAVFDALRGDDLWPPFTHAGREGRKLRAISDPAKLVAWSTTWRPGEGYRISRDPSGTLAGTTLTISPRPDALVMNLWLMGEDAESRRASAIDSAIAFAVDLRGRDVFGGVRLPEWRMDLDREYPIPRPLLYPELWGHGYVLQIIERDELVRISYKPEQAAEELERMRTAPMPPGATREDRGPLTIFRFVHDLTDDAAVDRARGEHHRWITSLTRSETGTFTNEHGDELVLMLSPTPHAPLTFYDAFHNHGYKAVFLTPDGGGDAELDEAAGWLAAKQLPDGTPVAGISIVAPTRDAALSALDRVRARGFNRLLYVDNKGTFWNPFPS